MICFHHLSHLDNSLDQTELFFVERCECDDKSEIKQGAKRKCVSLGYFIYTPIEGGGGLADIFQRLGFRLLVFVYL